MSDQDEITEVLETLVGEGKKFATPEDLAKSKVAADEHILKLEAENALFRERIQEAATIEDFIDKVQTSGQQSATPSTEPTETVSAEAVQGMTPEQVAELVAQTMAKRETETQAQRNLREAKAALGDKADLAISEKARELGKTPEEMENLARTEPAIFRTLMKPEPAKPDNSVPASGVNTTGMQTSEPTRNQAWYREQYKNNPQLRQNIKFVNQEMKDALENPEFFVS